MADKTSDLSSLSDEQIAAEMAKRSADARDAANKERLLAFQPLVDAGWGSPTMEKAVAALEALRWNAPAPLPGETDIRPHIAAAVASREVQNLMARLMSPTEIAPLAPVVARA